MGLLITFLLGIFILAGAAVAQWAKNEKLIEQMSIAIAFGTMTALIVLELIPEALESMPSGKWYIVLVCTVIGILLLKLLDIFIPEHDHEHGFDHDCTEQNVIHIGIVSTAAVIIHNIIEGMAVYSLTAQSVKSGAMVALGVGLHNIPMGMTIWSTLRREKRAKKAVLLTAAAIATFAGGVIMALFSRIISDFVIGILISLTLGMIAYIVCFELIPHLMHAKRKGLSALGALIGVAIIAVSVFLE